MRNIMERSGIYVSITRNLGWVSIKLNVRPALTVVSTGFNIASSKYDCSGSRVTRTICSAVAPLLYGPQDDEADAPAGASFWG